ncbi:MAG TPA: DNA ligase D [Terriglobales bacterium]|jgi:bifunctional non-homologous end joining protein LigD|nr:DNA ligase D [Terriglobales bacterium]
MSLKEYLRKRSFENTPEPPPGTPPPAGNRFYIQRHSATRLHYDLRLEMEGALRSWAVPKGPTLDPAEKRLAVLVEDHPLEYGEFEGTIPEGNYGAGKVILWDKGTYEWLTDTPPAQQWERGDLKFRLHGQKLVGEFALVRMKNRGKGNEWLLLKKKDFAAKPGWDPESDLRSVRQEAADPAAIPGAKKAAMPREVQPMLATLADSLPEGAEWLYEVKWDGVRALCLLDHGKLRLLSRTGNAMEAQYPEFRGLGEQLTAKSAVLDGEIVAFDEQGRPSFARLQPRIMANPKNVPHLARTQPVMLFAFDLLYLDGYDLREAPLAERQKALAAILKPSPLVRLSDHFTGNGRELMEAARQNGLEGIVAKRALSRYEPRRSRDWVKIKVVNQQEFVICGWIEGEREPFGSLALACYESGKLKYVGNVGSGFTQEMLETVFKKLKPLATTRSPLAEVPAEVKKAHWVKPELVCAVRYNSWTPDARLRAPVFQGLRLDVAAKDCVLEGEKTAAPTDEPAPPSSDTAPLLPGQQEEVTLAIDGHKLKFTHLNKVFYPREGYRKRDVINYYNAVADLILPHLHDRPLTLKRYPNGIEGEYFFQKDAPQGTPAWVHRKKIAPEEGEEAKHYVLAQDRATLLWLANLGCIDQNPMQSRVGSLGHPDFILLDLDPYNCGYDRIVEAAQVVRRRLEQLGLEGYPKTTGGDGMHIYIPLEPHYSFDQARSFAEVLARLVAHERPDLFTTPRAVKQREKGKVYFDYLQIGGGKTISAPYVLRAHPGAPVSTPLAWREVAPGLSPAQFHLGNVLERFARLGDLFEPVLKKPQRLEEALGRMEKMVRESGGS